jgi:hypothetical protein
MPLGISCLTDPRGHTGSPSTPTDPMATFFIGKGDCGPALRLRLGFGPTWPEPGSSWAMHNTSRYRYKAGV